VRTVRVLTVDDHPAFLDAARALILATPSFELAGQVTSGEAAVAAVARLDPDVVLMDVFLPDIDGYEATRRITALDGRATVVLISASDEALEGDIAALCGADAFVAKRDLEPRRLRELWQIHGRQAVGSR
jgi:DNA-binding NarL/FixJ family response regulator